MKLATNQSIPVTATKSFGEQGENLLSPKKMIVGHNNKYKNNTKIPDTKKDPFMKTKV